MVNVNRFNVEFAELYCVAGLDNIELCTVKELVLLELSLNKTHGQPCAVNGNVDFLKKIGKCADVILMTVGYNDTLDFLTVLLKIGEIGNNKVNAEHIRLRECKTAVNDYYVIFKLINGDVLSDLVESAEESDFNGFNWFLLCLLLF